MSITIAEKRPLSFVAPVVGASGALAGLFIGTAQGATFMGILLGAVILTAHAEVDYPRVAALAPRVFDTRNATAHLDANLDKVRKL